MKLLTISVLFLINDAILIYGYPDIASYQFSPPSDAIHEFKELLDKLNFQWNEFKEANNKRYSNFKEEEFRYHIYAYNSFRINLHNMMYNLGKYSYKLKMNEYGDLTASEFGLLKKGYRLLNATNNDGGIQFKHVPKDSINDTVDWREHGAVTEVKNQENCGSCWAFSSTGSLEGQHFLKNGKLVSLSEQNLIDCSYFNGNDGCDGGLMENAFKYVKENGGINSEDLYPYEGNDYEFCRYDPDQVAATVKGYISIPKGNETLLKYAVATVGPISVAIDASSTSFQFYSDGVYNEPDCSSTNLDHGVLAVGYGTTENGEDYWLVKNSWGPEWGEKGYIKMSRNKQNQCGIASYALYPLV
ncbi:hypothetical protein O3M35_003463 [Rhynocoris fuscipes]|uniref:Cathepsin L n=1 Tax=Rhynocoris fuscipes TaxID=488301 RepID=A0AAW1CKL5_9HEMI